MCWSLVVCSHVFSVVDATRHTKASWFKETTKHRNQNLPNGKICALDGRQKFWDVFGVYWQTETHDPPQSPGAFDWWLKCRSGQSDQLAHSSCWNAPLLMWKNNHQSSYEFKSLLALKWSEGILKCTKKINSSAWCPVTKERVCFLSSGRLCVFVYMCVGCVDVCVPRAWRVCECVQH